MTKHQILAPMPGVFYRRPSPGEAQFKSEGDHVAAGEAIGLVEVMKSFFPIEAEVAGRLVKFVIEDGAAVDAGDIVAEVDP